MEPTQIGRLDLTKTDRRNANSLPAAMRQLSPDLQRKTMLVQRRYGSREQCMAKLNPDAQLYAGRNSERAILGDAPTLGLLRVTYGENFPTMWLLPQIFDLVVYSNSRGTLNEQQATFLATAIAQEYGYLKVSELLLFFYQFKLGKYGHFYGVVDPMRITEALGDFIDERNKVIDKHRKEQEEAELLRDEQNSHGITGEEWCRMNGMPQFTDALDLAMYSWKCEDFISFIVKFINSLNQAVQIWQQNA